MLRVAILGGGIAGLAAAYELEQQRRAGKPIDWHLFEATDRLGGIIETTRPSTPDGQYILEGGPDAWVTEKPWARELAEELGLGDQIITSRDEQKKTYIWLDGELVAMPDRMRMMVPEDLASLNGSPLFSTAAREAYARETARADELKSAAPGEDESVASFVARHFGDEVLQKVAAPLLSGVFGGDVHKLSVRAVMPAFVRMEAEHGSLITAMQAQASARGTSARSATFTSLRRGMGSLVDAIVAVLPHQRLHLRTRADAIERISQSVWQVRTSASSTGSADCPSRYERVLIAVPVDAARDLLYRLDERAASLIPMNASSAVLACFCWTPQTAESIKLPPGFGFLVPQSSAEQETESRERTSRPKLLAGTFTDQKFPGRAPTGARVVRVFFGGPKATALNRQPEEVIAEVAWRELKFVLPGLPYPAPSLTTVRRWPWSLPQYEVGHLDRMKTLELHIQQLGGLSLLGNGYRGVGVPDLIRDARAIAREIGGEALIRYGDSTQASALQTPSNKDLSVR